MKDDMTVKDHYDNLLGDVYSWMAGDLSAKCAEFLHFLSVHHISGSPKEVAVDLGAGNGIQSIALAQVGFDLLAIDFNDQLLNELAQNTKEYRVTIIKDDLRKVLQYAKDASLIACCGDTLTHLDNRKDIFQLVSDIHEALRSGGRAIFSFRDYSVPLEGVRRFIPVKRTATAF